MTDNLTISIKQDGTWLNFRASTGKQASLRVESLGEERRGIIGRALLDWCADRRTDVPAQPPQISDEAINAALDAWYPDEDWRSIITDLDGQRAEMRAAIAAALEVMERAR